MTLCSNLLWHTCTGGVRPGEQRQLKTLSQSVGHDGMRLAGSASVFWNLSSSAVTFCSTAAHATWSTAR